MTACSFYHSGISSFILTRTASTISAANNSVKTFRETLAFLIVRDNAHQNAFAKALETLGVDWGKLFPVPNYDINKYPECRKYVEMGYHNAQFNFRLDQTRISEIFQGQTPSRNKGTLTVTDPPKGFPVPTLPEMPNEHSPGISDMNFKKNTSNIIQ